MEDEQPADQQPPGRPQPAPAPAASPKRAPRRVAFAELPPPEPEADAAATPQRAPNAGDDDASDGGGTPYDGVLAMLRQGPLAANSPRSFPRPRAASLLTAGAGRTPGPGGAPMAASPSPLPSGGSGQPSAEPSARRGTGYARSRLGLGAASGTPSTGLRSSYTARSASRFSLSHTPMHMQPLAVGGPAGSGGAPGASRFGLAAAAAAAGGADGEPSGPAPLPSPAPLAWTPMRGNMAAGSQPPMSGANRKAESASPAGEGGAGEQRPCWGCRALCCAVLRA